MQARDIKTYSDTYLFRKYPLYNKALTDAIMKDPVIEKSSESFKDVIYEIRRSRVSSSLLTILQSRNTILLDCQDPLPRAFKVFGAKDIKSKDRLFKVFIDCSNGTIEKDKKTSEYIVNETKLISYLINAGMVMIYHKKNDAIMRRSNLIQYSSNAFAKLFTFIIDYLTKVSIQESSKMKVIYLSSKYFLHGIMNYDLDDKSANVIAKKNADLTDREVNMLNILMEKNCKDNPYDNIKTFIINLREVMHFSDKVISPDMVVERWMMQYGPGTVFGLEYFPALSAMITDAYVGGYLNQQKSIEKVLGVSLVDYSKSALDLIESVIQ